MAIDSFNSSGVRAPDCKACVKVDSDHATLLDFFNIFKGGSGAMTPDTSGLIGTNGSGGPGGDYFAVQRHLSTFNTDGWSFSNAVAFDAATPNWESLFISFVVIGAANSNCVLAAQNASTQGNFPGTGFKSSVGSGLQPSLYVGSSDLLDLGTNLAVTFWHSIGISYTYKSSMGIYLDGGTANGGSQATGSDGTGHGAISQSLGRIGAVSGQGYMNIRMYAWAYFNSNDDMSAEGRGALTQSDFASLHNSISTTGGNTFSLITPGTPAGPRPSMLFLHVPLAGLGWIIRRRTQLAREQVGKPTQLYRQDKESRLYLPSWFKKAA